MNRSINFDNHTPPAVILAKRGPRVLTYKQSLDPRFARMTVLAWVFLLSPHLLFAATPTPASSPAASQIMPNDNIPLLINSDSTEMNFKTGVNVYDGHVHATHGKSTLVGDTVTTYKNKEGKLEKILIIGKQAVMHYEEDPNDKPIDAQADTITDYPLIHTIVLEGDAVAMQGKNVIHAPSMKYNTETKIMQAYSTKEQRTHILLYNDQSQTTPKPSDATSTGKKTS